MTKCGAKLNPAAVSMFRLSEWRSNVCSAVTKQTAKSTFGRIGFFNGLALSLRDQNGKRQ